MQITLLGKHGQLGWELQRTLAPLGSITALDFPEIDLAQSDTYTSILDELRPGVIVNTAAYTAVDQAESEPEIAMAVNGDAPGILAEFARRTGAILIHYSTDYVFDGGLARPHTELDTPNPLNLYGKSKLAGERAVEQVGGKFLILRTSWVYSMRGDSFVNKVLRWSREQQTLRIVTDQVSGPTWARMLAEATAQLLTLAMHNGVSWLGERAGLYHLAGSGYASRFTWAEAILRNDPEREQQVTRQVLPALTADFPTPARRPLFSALDCNLFKDTFDLRLPDWEDGLRMAMETL